MEIKYTYYTSEEIHAEYETVEVNGKTIFYQRENIEIEDLSFCRDLSSVNVLIELFKIVIQKVKEGEDVTVIIEQKVNEEFI